MSNKRLSLRRENASMGYSAAYPTGAERIAKRASFLYGLYS